MAANAFFTIAENALYGYGVTGHAYNTKEAGYQGRFKIGHLYLYVQLHCFQTIAKSSPFLSPYPLLTRPIQVVTALVGWSLLTRYILDLSGVTPKFVKFIFKKFDFCIEFFSKGISQAVLIHAIGLIVFKKDLFALSYFSYFGIDQILRKKIFPPLQEPIKHLHNGLNFIGQQFCFPLWLGIPNLAIHLYLLVYRRAKRADPELEKYKPILIDHYVEGLKQLQIAVNELKAKYPDRQEELKDIIGTIKDDFDFSRPGDWAVFHEIRFLDSSRPFLEKLPERQAQLEKLAARIKGLAPEKIRIMGYALILGAEIIKAPEHPDFIDLRDLVHQFRHPANLYSGTYLGPQDSPNYRPHADILLSPQALEAKAALI